MSSASRARFADVVRTEPVDVTLAALLVGAEVEPDLEPATPLATLDALAAAARRHVPRGCGGALAGPGLQQALGREAGFGGSAEDYADVRSSLLHEVLRRGRGLPLTLSLVWVEVARRLGVPAFAVALPGHVVVALGAPGDRVVVDPFAGGAVLDPTGVTGIAPAEPVAFLLRLLTNVRALTARQDRVLDSARTRLWAVELSLLLPRHPVELRRERGELLVRLGDHVGGAAALRGYAELVEGADTAAAESARRSARLALARLN